MRGFIPVLLCLAALPLPRCPAGPASFRDDFENGADAWFPTQPDRWRVTETAAGRVYHLLGKSAYEPPHRSPHSISLLTDRVWGDFVLTARVKTLQTSRGHRDMCLFFGYQDPSRFYYVHLGEHPDPHSSQVFLVDGAPRVKITTSPDNAVPWQDDHWHDVKVVRDTASGRIEVYFDDLETPLKVARDTTFPWGLIGLGSFDDLGQWDDVQIEGTLLEGHSPVLFQPVPPKATGAAPAAPTPLSFRKWSGSVNVPDPVAISVDDRGRAFVTQTRRRKIQDLDIRDNRDWIPDDVGLRTVADKLAFYRERLAPGNPLAHADRVADLNRDGSHDYHDLRVLSERIHLVEDTDGDGTADAATVFAEDFRTEVTGIAAGVLWHEGAVYATIAPDVWKLRDTTGDGRADRREVIAHGFGHHIAYAGHDMHGLTVGPDGMIYWTVGDKGISVATPEGREFHHPNEGGVLRCHPDGSGFEVFARGLRNVQEIAFDEAGNLFGVDNDADMPGEKERFVHLVEGMDAGWRCNYQYRGKAYNPWMAEHLWEPAREDQPAYLMPPVCHYVDGPCGFAYNPGTALDSTWRRTFFLTEAPGGKQWAFQVEPDGPGFRMTNSRRIGNGIAITGWAFGPDGALYGTDWGVTGYALTESGAIWTFDVPEAARSPEREETRHLMSADFQTSSPATLQRLLGHADQRVRLKAQFELVRRGDPSPFLGTSARGPAPALARIHAIWGLGQLRDAPPLLALLQDDDPAIRAQAAKTLGQLPAGIIFDPWPLAERLGDPCPVVRFHAAMALGNRATPRPDLFQAVLDFIRSHPEHPLFRHAGARALDATATLDDLVALRTSPEATARVAAILALRSRQAPEIAVFLDDGQPRLREEAARAIHDGDSIPAALPHLAATLASPRHHAEAFIRRAINANLRLGSPEAAARVSAYALRADAPLPMRLEALESLLDWVTPPPLDRVDGWRRDLPPRDPSPLGRQVAGDLDRLARSGEDAILERVVALATRLGTPLAPEHLATLLSRPEAPASLQIVALENLGTEEAARTGLRSRDAEVRIHASRLLARTAPGSARAHLAEVLQASGPVRERQEAILILAELEADDVLRPWIGRLGQGDVPPALHLELLEAANLRSLPVEFPRNPADALAEWVECLEGGTPARGEETFRNHLGGQCTACHKVDGRKGGSAIGPNLKSVGQQERRHLLESIVLPMASIAEGYGNLSLTLRDGTAIAGQFREETASHVVMRDGVDGTDRKIPVAEIVERGPLVSLMPPMSLILTKRETRDLVAYLATLRAK